MENRDLTHIFSLLVCRDWPLFSKEERRLLSALPKPYASRFFLTHGTVQIALRDNFGAQKRFTFAADTNHHFPMVSWLAYKTSFNPVSAWLVQKFFKPLKFAEFCVEQLIDLAMTIKSGTIGAAGGFIPVDNMSDRYHERLDIQISKADYDRVSQTLETEIERGARYHLLFNNCAGAAVSIARDAFGEDIIRGVAIETPNRLSRYFRSQAKLPNSKSHLRFVTFEDRFKNGEIHSPEPLTA